MEMPRRKRMKASEEDTDSRYRQHYHLLVNLYLDDPEHGVNTEVPLFKRAFPDSWHTFQPDPSSSVEIQYARVLQMLRQDVDSSVADNIRDAVVFWVGNETAKSASGFRLTGGPFDAVTHDEIMVRFTDAISLFVSYEVLSASPIASLIHGIKNLFSKQPEPGAKMLARRAPRRKSGRGIRKTGW